MLVRQKPPAVHLKPSVTDTGKHSPEAKRVLQTQGLPKTTFHSTPLFRKTVFLCVPVSPPTRKVV